MPRIFVSSVLNAPPEKVWATIRPFDAVVNWLPFVKSSPIEDGGDPTRVGCVRVFDPDRWRGISRSSRRSFRRRTFVLLHVRQLPGFGAQPLDHASCTADYGW